MRRALRALTHGVYVLSTHHDDVDDFLIVSLVMQTSIEPPRVAFAVSVNARILPSLRSTRRAVLGVLPAGATAAVRRYGAPGGVRQPPRDAKRTSHHIALPPEASFWLELSLYSEQPVGDHVLFVADVANAIVADEVAAEFAPFILANSGFPYGG